jgi:8-oxo-dGTP pyrophosphatase MutT (NUDIX family)
MKKLLLKIWRLMPFWMQRIALFFLRPHYEVSVGAVILNERNQLLLCHHTYRREFPWGMPGGDINPGEDPVDAVRRELWEETGFRAGEVELLLVENWKEYRQVSLTYWCKGVSGDFVANDEISHIQYFDLSALPAFFPAQRKTIDRVIERLGL